MDDAQEEREKEASVLEKFAADKELSPSYEETKLPKWLYKYLVYRFNLLDRTGERICGYTTEITYTWRNSMKGHMLNKVHSKSNFHIS